MIDAREAFPTGPLSEATYEIRSVSDASPRALYAVDSWVNPRASPTVKDRLEVATKALAQNRRASPVAGLMALSELTVWRGRTLRPHD